MTYHHIHMKCDGAHITIHGVSGEGSTKRHDVFTINPRERSGWELRDWRGVILLPMRRTQKMRALERAFRFLRDWSPEPG